MFLKNQLNNMGIKSKTFIATISSVTFGLIILYIILYLFVPKVYILYKKANLRGTVEAFISDLDSEYFININQTLDDFCLDNDLMIIITDEEDTLLYSSFNNEKINDINKYNQYKSLSMNKIEQSFKFYFKQYDSACNLNVQMNIQAGKEVRTILMVFLPFAGIANILITITMTIFYSKVISTPIIEISKKADKIAKLDFTEKFKPKGKDEISNLLTSLNIMSDNLCNTINELEKANEALTLDIETKLKEEKERKRFLATISHELKSPITIIAGQVQGMMYNIGKYQDRDKYLNEVYEVTKKMEELVFELLELSRQDQDTFLLDIKKVNLSMILKNTLKESYYFIEEKKLKLKENIEDDVFIDGDQKLLYKAISNIIKNSVEHTPEGREISILLNKRELKVKNYGVHIESEDLKNIFKAFYRVDKSRNNKTGGTGLGLYIVSSALKKHENLKFNMESEEDYVLFTVEFLEM